MMVVVGKSNHKNGPTQSQSRMTQLGHIHPVPIVMANGCGGWIELVGEGSGPN